MRVSTGARRSAAGAPGCSSLFASIVALMLLSWPGGVRLMADDTLTIDDRSSGDFAATLGGSWRMIADGVMGGASTGRLSLETVEDRACLRLQGQVRLENNGGFIQAALNLADTPAVDASAYTGLLLEVHGNDQQYNLHLRTDDVWLPWQSYRVSFHAPSRWETVRLPFTGFAGYRIGKPLDLRHLERIGLVAIGRAFDADLCIAKVALYRDKQ